MGFRVEGWFRDEGLGWFRVEGFGLSCRVEDWFRVEGLGIFFSDRQVWDLGCGFRVQDLFLGYAIIWYEEPRTHYSGKRSRRECFHTANTTSRAKIWGFLEMLLC